MAGMPVGEVMEKRPGGGGAVGLLLGTSKQSRATNRKVATFEKSLPASFRSVLIPMTFAYWQDMLAF